MEMSSDKSTSDPQSQMNISEKSFGEEGSPDKSSGEPHASPTDKSSSEPHASPTDKSSSEPHASPTDKCSSEENPLVGTRNKYVVEEKQHVDSIDECIDDDESQTVTPDKSVEQETLIRPIDIQSQASTIDMSPGMGKSHGSTTDGSTGEEKLQMNATDNSSSEPELQVSSTNESLAEEKSQGNVTDMYSDKPQSPVSITNASSTEEKPLVGIRNITAVSSRGEDSQVDSSATLLVNPTDQSSEKPPSQVTTTGESQDSVTVQALEESKRSISSKSSSGEKSRGNSKEKSVIDPKAQTDTTYKPEQKPPTSPSDESGDQKSAEDSSEQDSTTAGITEKQDLQADQMKYPRHRRMPHSEEGDQPLDKTERTVIDEKPATGYNWLIGLIASALVLAVLYSLFSSKGQPPARQESELEIFLKEFARLKKDFPGQYEGLWFRSEKLLKRHLNTSHPSAPSIIILTAAQDGEWTLRCVSQRLAKSYADSFSARWLMVHGPSKSKYDSATSKMQIDEELSTGFQSNSRAAVLYRLETLPSGSLLILYKYCDHENAAFKNVALVLTVLLDEPTLERDLSFTEVEEKVKDFLWERFAYSEVSAHNEMDVDKLSGVWSRISHVVLPVLPVGSIEGGSCPGIKG
ncbi:torsin-1A-interacting protein 2-like [Dendropsophus ebraccatus]|uniref:torsin-1A-interacting protein 2-like n=1 Tax=Dendropsophus ebraccatus TaxID=150705 RepID=UPI0038323363